ncbi:protein XRI1-like isoform X2 [Magnolia sinica]|uniref:protein XRI1-like isoform X2 n=1 Tax=Magnolia sinica TaxID=86752 RepID=UPI00265801EE|nr:protein XRI1-like isoform X2 [Magnolia sinica]
MDNNVNYNGQWEWQGDDYYLQRDPNLNISPCLWDGVNQNEEDYSYMLDETTPVKACMDFDCHVSEYGENIKGLDECREPSQLKRRRMLHFNPQATDPCNCDEQIPSAFVKSKDREMSLVEDGLAENMQWAPSFPDDRCTSGNDGLDQSSEGWLANCFIDSDEMNVSGASDDQVDISEFCKVPPEMGADIMQEPSTPAPRSFFKIISGRKSCMPAPTKLATSVAYPFALIKPCGVEGDVTLKDINQRIRIPPPSESKDKNDEDPACSYPTSAFSGKPVVVKTKIRTEGGKGSITIMRTKG